MKNLLLCLFALFALLTTQVVAQEFAVNGDFETGDTSSWESFPTANSTFAATSDAFGGSFGGEVFNDDSAAAAVVKQANLGIGVVMAGDDIDISFAAKGATANGGVVFAEFFSEIDGGGVSSNLILGSGPLQLTSNWQTFNFSTPTGFDVSAGITLQFAVVTGGDAGSMAQLFVDDVSISRFVAVPEPGAMAIFGLAALGAFVRRRR